MTITYVHERSSVTMMPYPVDLCTLGDPGDARTCRTERIPLSCSGKIIAEVQSHFGLMRDATNLCINEVSP